MKTSARKIATWAAANAIAIFGLSLGPVRAEDTAHNSVPMIKNLMALTYRAPAVQPPASQELAKKQLKRPAATAESSKDHLKLARYYTAEADGLDAQAAGYEQAAATYRNGPFVKNLMAPSTPGRYEFFAKGLRNEAKSNRALAASHQLTAKEIA